MLKPKINKLLRLKINFSILLIVVVVAVTFVFLLRYFNYIAETEKKQLLTENSHKILQLSKQEIKNTFYYLGVTLDNPEVDIAIDNRTLNICYKESCNKYNLIKLAKLLEYLVPKFVDFKITLNNNLLHFNTNQKQYERVDVYKLNNKYKMFISTSINRIYWNKQQYIIQKPFWIISLSFLLSVIILLSIFVFLLKMYKIRYMEIHYKRNKIKEENLLKKIWELQYQKKEEKELQYLFAYKANKLAQTHSNKENINLKSLPCSIVLQQEKATDQIIDLSEMVDIFLKIFAKFGKNFTIQKSSKNITFESKALLYQTVYSILNYLFFLSSELDIKLDIGTQNTEERIFFRINKIDISSEKELLVYSDRFFKSHTNVFILEINQVFYILRKKNFICKVFKEKENLIIEIIKQRVKKSNNMNNVILMNKNRK